MLHRVITLLGVAAVFVASCGSDDSTSGTTSLPGVSTTIVPATTTTSTTPTTTAPPSTTTSPTTTTTTTATSSSASPTTTPVGPSQPAIWPAADVVFTTPQAAAEDFLARVFGRGPVLGDFQPGDSRSGEFSVYASDDSGTPLSNERSVLLLRQLGPSDGWFVIGAASDRATITVPESQAIVPAGPVSVEGLGEGFEATIVVEAIVVGQPDRVLDQEVTMAGNFGEALPYGVTLDLSGASPGDVVMLLVRGGVGLETDPGNFGAIPVVIAS